MDYLSACCPGCASFLVEPFVRCVQCNPPLLLCLQTTSFPLLHPAWRASEELALLDSLLDCGYGNWHDVAMHVRGKTQEECEEHHTFHYSVPPLGKDLRRSPVLLSSSKAIPFTSSEDPPRPAADSPLCWELAGYMAPRSDFAEEYDQCAEWDLRDLEFSDDESDIFYQLKLAVVDIYLSRVRERQRRKRIIRKLGLINLRRFQGHLGIGAQSLLQALRPFCRLLRSLKLDKILQSFALELELRQEVKRLKQGREAGILTLRGLKLFGRLWNARLCCPTRIILSDVMHFTQDTGACQQWLQRQAALDAGQIPTGPIVPTLGRRNAPPLDLTGLPGTEKLTENEKELCRQVRLVPESYLMHRAVLEAESRKQGGLRLARARSLIKIDVNKTRRLYDFLLKQGFINQG
uniref:transcriptional adapter 2-alpha isoform X2 n=1 Tax=Myxine glutinosa TaxID=7769 RepID=UPI00358F3FC5